MSRKGREKMVPWKEFKEFHKERRNNFMQKFRDSYLPEILKYVEENELEVQTFNNGFQYRITNPRSKNCVDFWETSRFRTIDGYFKIGMKDLWEELTKLAIDSNRGTENGI